MHPEKTRQLIERERLRRGRDGMKYCETAIEALNGDRRATFVGWHTKLSPGRTAAPTIAALRTSCFYASLLVAIRFCTLLRDLSQSRNLLLIAVTALGARSPIKFEGQLYLPLIIGPIAGCCDLAKRSQIREVE